MMNLKNISLAISLLFVMLTSSGCVSVKNDKVDTSAYDGGVFVSINNGTNWKQMVSMPSVSGQPQKFSGVNVVSFEMDPGDNEALYFGSSGSGLFYTYDSTNTWQKADAFRTSVIRSIAIDPNDKCTVYVSVKNKVFKSEDCNRSYQEIYFDNDSAVAIEAIAVDPANSNNVFIAVSRGDILVSNNAGEGWHTVARVNNRIKKILIDPNNPKNIYAVTFQKGVFVSNDSGETFAALSDLNKVLSSNNLGMNIRDFVFVDSEPATMYIATYYGLLKTVDSGENWEKIELIMPEKKAMINALAVNPKNSQEIYYVTNTIFYRSMDGGANWTPLKLPTTRAGWRLLIDPVDPKIIYMGLRKLEE